MAMENYRYYFDIDPDYFPAVNEAVINSNPDMWKKFFPHDTFVKLVKNTVNVLDRKQKLSIWVEGAYGTGKSHAVLTLKKLLDTDESDVQEYFDKYGMDKDLCNNFLRIKNSGRVLTVHRYGSSNIHGDNDLVLAIQESIEKAFAVAGIENKGKDSLKEAVIRYLTDAENKQSFNVYVKGSYADLFGGDDVDAIVEKLRTYEDAALHALMDKIFKVARERQIRAFSMTASDLADWVKEVIEVNDLKAIVFIWDEFTEYFYNNSRNLTGFQELCELSETEPFYFILVTHVSSGLFHEGDKDFIKLNGRFVNPHSLISLPENIAFQLMGAAMEKNTDKVVQDDWAEVTDELSDRTKESRKIVMGIASIKEKEMLDILPIHPYTALLLKHISSAFDSNQRSMFDFIKNDRGDEIKGFQWFIDNFGPEDDNPLLTIDMLWEFFYDKGRDLLAHDIRTVLDYFTRSQNQKLDVDEKRILKTVLLLQAISRHAGDSVELFIPNEKNVDHAFEGSDMDGGAAGRCAEKLVRDKILFKKQLGNGKFQYNAYVNEVSGAELDKFKEDIDRKTTSALITEQLTDRTTVTDALTLGGAMKLRYELKYVSAADFDQTIRALRNCETEFENKIPAVACFAKNDTEANAIAKKIRDAIKDGSFNIVFIDATVTPFGQDGYSQYRDEMAQSMYQQGKDNTLASQYSNNAKDALKKWKTRIAGGEFVVYTKKKPDGERATSMESLMAILQGINKEKFPDCLEAAYNVLPTMFTPSSLKLGVECGATRTTRQIFSSGNVTTKLETALQDAWNDDRYWESHPNILISRIKKTVDEAIQKAFDDGGRISIKSIYEIVQGKPYGFMPCNLSAFILGFVLKEYIDGSYSWSDGLTNDALNLDKLKEMVAEVINLRITPNARYKDKYIVAMTPEEKAFNEATSIAFGIPLHLCTSIEQTRERIRNKMKEYSFPIWTIKEIIPGIALKTEESVIRSLIDCYCGIANSNNMGGSKTDNSIALEIGEICLKNKNASEDLKGLLTKENCTEGMKKYVADFEGGQLIELASKIGDNGQYINVLRGKFDADAANWVWNIETAQQKIREVILEYKIISESSKVIGKNITFTNTIREWCDKCGLIRISYAAAKNQFGAIESFMEMLFSIKRAGTILDSQKQKFLDLLVANAEGFNRFYNNQVDLFKEVCAFYLDGFSDEEIRGLYQTLPTGVFTDDKAAYTNMVDAKAKDYRSNLGNEQLKALWKEKTKSASPREWSRKHLMPILSLVPDAEVQNARAAFGTLNRNHPDASSVEKAKEYLEKASFYRLMDDQTTLDRIFRDTIIKNYAVMLTDIDEVKRYLDSRITQEPYDWFGLPEVDKKLQQMAEAKYNQEGCTRALEKIDSMDVADVKRYLKELIKDNMTVGIEIIKEN
ncbi:MAG: hypothetical protein KHX08_01355 [Clostridiales bacterium]|nr:hypothetical protein [Clostridiales bacterium]